MLIGVRKRFLFVANTKAASTSIEGAIGPHAEVSCPGGPQGKHLPLAKVRHQYGFIFSNPAYPFGDFFKFGVMRDPLEWIGSWYRYRKGNKVNVPLPKDMDFAGFWEQGDWNVRRRDGTPYQQSDMFCNHRGEVMTDLIIPYHRLDEVLPRVLSGLKIRVQLPHLNVSALRDTGDLIPESLLPTLRAHFARDYAIFDSLDDKIEAGLARLGERAAATAQSRA